MKILQICHIAGVFNFTFYIIHQFQVSCSKCGQTCKYLLSEKFALMTLEHFWETVVTLFCPSRKHTPCCIHRDPSTLVGMLSGHGWCTVFSNLPSRWHHVRYIHCHVTQDFVTDLSGSHSYLSTRCETGNVLTSEVMPFSVDPSLHFVLIRLKASDHWQSLECESCFLEVLF